MKVIEKFLLLELIVRYERRVLQLRTARFSANMHWLYPPSSLLLASLEAPLWGSLQRHRPLFVSHPQEL